ncbi:unnamed protein product [Rhodiola kirilowii]
MAPRQNPKVAKAFHAMKDLGVSEDVVKPALKNLLKLYDKNWALIEAENYRALADAIFESEEEKVAEQKRKPIEDDVPNEPEQPLKRHRPRHQGQDLASADAEDCNATTNASGTSLHDANKNCDPALAGIDPQQLQATGESSKLVGCNINPMDESEPDSPPTCLRLRDRRLTSSKALSIVETSERPCNTNEAVDPSPMSLHDQHKELVSLKYPSEEERPFSEKSPRTIYMKEPKPEPGIIPTMVTDTCTLFQPEGVPVVNDIDIPLEEVVFTDISQGAQTILNGKDTEEGSFRMCNSAKDAVYTVPQPGNETSSSFHYSANGKTDDVLPLPKDVALSAHGSCTSNHHNKGGSTDNSFGTLEEAKVLEAGIEKSSSINTDKQNQTRTHETIYLLDVTDITKGEEKVKISMVNRYNDVTPPSFCYIRQNLVGQNAFVNASLAQIGKEDYCSTCAVDCLSLKEPCICARTTGGKYVYTSDGILNDEFLEECISMTHNTQKERKFFCEEYPLEFRKDKNALEHCKGHLVRRIIKECWWRCHCSKHCTNRLVQRGITHKLQVFMTSGGKGWGLRTLEDLPKGAFVCEFVGEILTLSELYFRNQSSLRNCAYAMLLDAGWASSKELTDDKALCLDASVYGNVARFINHRCTDANLVAIPIRVETPGHLYHRVAFFTSKKVSALEELTRDYGIDFADSDHCTKPFRCRCGSSFCRNIKRYNRKRIKGNALEQSISRD